MPATGAADDVQATAGRPAPPAFVPRGAPRAVAPDNLATLARPGETVYIPGSSGAPLAFVSDLLRHRGRSRELRVLTTFVPGINPLDIDGFDASARITGLFMQPGFSSAQREGRFRALPMSYAGFVRHIRDCVEPDLAVVQVSPPDSAGLCSLGPAAEFTPLVLSKSRRILALVNHRTPRIPGAAAIRIGDADYVCEVDTPLPTYVVAPDNATEAIARHIAPLVEDACTLQIGLGKVPTALARLLRDRRNLRLHSGMLSDGLVDLDAAGALDRRFLHTACVLVGSSELYSWAAEFARLRVAGCEHTHDPRTLLALERFVAVNSALEVDLFGQCNLEHANGRAISGAGGAPDFARAARLSSHGRSIVALNATHHDGKGSRIVPCLTDKSVTSLARVDIDYVVTEYGVAPLEGASVHERAEAIIGVAAPAFRAALQEAWREISRRL